MPWPRAGHDMPGMSRRGFTLPELMVAIAVFGFVVLGVVFAHLFGLSMFRITENTLTTTDDTREAMGRMANEIRTCQSAWIGNVKNGSYQPRLDGEVQQGNALLIRPNSNTNNFIIYFVNPSDQSLRRTTSTPGSATILTESITNSQAFSSRNFTGGVLTNNQNNRVIHINLEFYQPQRFRQVADYYKLETSVTRRASE